MKLEDAINASQIHSARGYKHGQCVVSVAFYGGCLRWLTGWEGNWAKNWKEIPDEERHKLDGLDFRPGGPPPEEDVEDSLYETFRQQKDTLEEIYKIYDQEEEEEKRGIDPFTPIGERDD